MMNNIVLAKVTHDMLSPDIKKEVEAAARVRHRSLSSQLRDIDSMVEADKWQLYSLAMSDVGIPPMQNYNYEWTPSRDITWDVEQAYKVYRFEERLKSGEYSEPHMDLMRV